jgi:REP element-mobilizing transposase RayT
MALLIQNPAAPRRRTLRLPHYDYTFPGAYFLTICTHRRASIFGQITDGAMSLGPFGEAAAACWRDLPSHYPNANLDAFVVMPNHVHGILLMQEVSQSARGLSEVVRGFKTFSARRINALRATAGKPLWQRGYHEHIVRGEADLQKIRDYIATNPARWAVDRNKPGYAPATRAGLKPAPTTEIDA